MNESTPTEARTDRYGVNPYNLPEKIWTIVRERLQKKWKCDFTQDRPTELVERPRIVWSIYSRTPGSFSRTGKTSGASFSTLLPVDGTNLPSEFVQSQMVYYDFEVYARTNADLNELAWEFEQAVQSTVGPLQGEIDQFLLAFDQQLSDKMSVRTVKGDDEISRRVLRFAVQLPIRYKTFSTPIEVVEIKEIGGWQRAVRQEFTMDSTMAPRFDVPLPSDGAEIYSIDLVEVRRDDYTWKLLVPSTDYTVTKDPDTRNAYIEWTEYGITPLEDQVFRVDYHYVAYRKTTRYTTN